ncbi:MFS transporter [Serpentinimonas barnesii]|uniref:MFS transporter n=1 Tax=Serpentinimonas barnesii TaxID=1458427 RepID=UPI000497745E|nr:MFS transporter [Serpentinimonas barnesii]
MSARGYKTIYFANALLSLADGLYYPFLIAFLYEMDGIVAAGVGLGIIAIMDSVGTYFVGGWVDRYGRKPFLVASACLSVSVYLAYPLISYLEQPWVYGVLLLVLVLDGLTDGSWDTIEAVYLGDVTRKATRGRGMGNYWGAGGIIFGVAMIAAGLVGIQVSFMTVALVVAAIYFLGILVLLRLEESLQV